MSARDGSWPLISLMLAAPHIGCRARWPNVLHAVTTDGMPFRTWPKGLYTSACGITGLRLVGDGRGNPVQWPPRLKGLPPKVSRCAECHDLTGRKRPASTFSVRKRPHSLAEENHG